MMITTLSRADGPKNDLAALSRRAVLPTLALTTYAAAALDAEAAPIITSDEGLTTGMVSYPSSGFELPAFVARPAGRGRFPVVIVVTEVFGLHAYIADMCRRLAREGYLAIAPSFFARAGDPSTLTEWDAIRAIVNTATNAQVMGDLEATLAYLGRHRSTDPRRMAITGFCWGGAVTWMASARFPALKAGVAWYGRLRTRPDQAGEAREWPLDVAAKLNGPVLGLYASTDSGIPQADVDAMNAALAAAPGNQSQIIVFPDTQHGFHADYRAQYNPTAAQTGWARMLSWFGRHGVNP
jgi:carboxymethylenebutenolidase